MSGSARSPHPVAATIITAVAASLPARILIVIHRMNRQLGDAENLPRFRTARCRELDHDLRATLDAATCVHLAAPALDQAPDDCQPEPGAAGVGREGGFEHPFELIVRNTGAVVAHDQDTPLEVAHCPARARLSCVVKQVEHHLHQFLTATAYRRAISHHTHAHRPATKLEELGDLADHLTTVDHLERTRLLLWRRAISRE